MKWKMGEVACLSSVSIRFKNWILNPSGASRRKKGSQLLFLKRIHILNFKEGFEWIDCHKLLPYNVLVSVESLWADWH